MDKEIKSIFDKLSLAIEKEIKLQLRSAIIEIEEECSIVGLNEKKFYERKLKNIFKAYKMDLMAFGKIVKYSKEDFISLYNNERDIIMLKEEYGNDRLRSALISDRARFYLKAEILEYLKQKAGEETTGETHQQISHKIPSGLTDNRESGNNLTAAEEKKQILTFKETCEFLSMKPPTLYKYTSQRLIPFIKKSKNIYFKRKELEEWLELGRKKTKSQISGEIDRLKKRISG